MLLFRRLLQRAAFNPTIPQLCTPDSCFNAVQTTSRLLAALHANTARSVSTVPSWPPPKSSASWEEYSKQDIEHIRARIFGGHVGDGTYTGRKAIAAIGKLQTHVARYYPEAMDLPSKKALKLWTTDWYELRQEKIAQRRRRGKYVPRKGAGKRTGKKKGR